MPVPATTKPAYCPLGAMLFERDIELAHPEAFDFVGERDKSGEGWVARA